MALDINATIPVLQPMINTINYLVNIIQLMVGGIFGIYIILVVLRWRESRKINKILEEIRDDIKALRKKAYKKK